MKNNNPIVDNPFEKTTPAMKKSFLKWLEEYFPNKITKRDISIFHMRILDKQNNKK